MCYQSRERKRGEEGGGVFNQSGYVYKVHKDLHRMYTWLNRLSFRRDQGNGKKIEKSMQPKEISTKQASDGWNLQSSVQLN